MTETLEKPQVKESGIDFPPIFGKCPICNKALAPRDRYTNAPKAPPVGKGELSRAKCSGCNSIIQYIGGGEWELWNGT